MLNVAGILMVVTLLAFQHFSGGNDMVQVTVVLKVAPWNPLTKSDFRVYVNGSSSLLGKNLKVNVSKSLVFYVPRGSYLEISGDLEVIGDYGFWYRLENVNGSGRSIGFTADRDVVVYLNYSANHVLLSRYFIAVYILLALLLVRRYLRQTKTFKKAT